MMYVMVRARVAELAWSVVAVRRSAELARTRLVSELAQATSVRAISVISVRLHSQF